MRLLSSLRRVVGGSSLLALDGDAHLWSKLNEKARKNAHILAYMLRFLLALFV